jgi:hypothetical protein
MKFKEKEGMPIFRKDSNKLQEGLKVWMDNNVKSKSKYVRRKEYWDNISTCQYL